MAGSTVSDGGAPSRGVAVGAGLLVAVLMVVLAIPASAAVIDLVAANETELAGHIGTANADTANHYRITLSADITLTTQLPTITGSVEIVAGAGSTIERSGAVGIPNFRIFTVDDAGGVAGSLSLNGLTIANGRVKASSGGDGLGGAIYVAPSGAPQKNGLTITGCTLRDNTVIGGDSNNSSNAGAGNGGAIALGTQTTLGITGSILMDNEARGGTALASFRNGGSAAGGAIYLPYFAGPATTPGIGWWIQDTQFLRNAAIGTNGNFGGGAAGGAIHATGSPGLFSGNLLEDNQAIAGQPAAAGNGGIARGGGMYLQSVNVNSTLSVSGCIFRNNVVTGGANRPGEGGAIHVTVQKTIDISDTLFEANGASGGQHGRGGGIVVGGVPAVTLTRVRFLQNSASTAGGAYYQANEVATVLDDSCIVANSDVAVVAETGGAGSLLADGNWWGHITGPGPTAGSGDGDTAEGVTLSSFLNAPPAGLECPAANPYDCGDASVSATGTPGIFEIEFTTADAGFDLIAVTEATDVSHGGFSPAGCESSGTDMTCTASVEVADFTSPSITYAVDSADGDLNICEFTGFLLGEIDVTTTAAPMSVAEPGAAVTFTVRVDNTGNTGVDLTGLDDDVHGDLDGQGTCATPQAIAPGGFYQCAFTATVSGNAGGSATNTVTASGTSAAGAVSDMDSATVTVTDVAPTMTVTKTAAPSAVDEPGGSVSFTVRVDNTGTAEAITLTALADDVHGDLDGKGTCSVPQSIAASGYYQCSFGATVSGNGGDSETDTVTATASDDEGNAVQAQDSATVTVTDVAPALTVTKTAAPSAVDEPGGSVSFTVRVDNTGTAEAITLTALADDVHGDLDGQGSCSVPQSIAASSFYECSFGATVSGNGGDSETDTVTATASDDDGNTVQAQDSATVTVTDVAPALTVTKTASPSAVDEPGGSVSFTIRVDNAGTAEAITLTALADDVHGDLDGQGTCSVPQSIAASSYYECSFSATVSGNGGDSETDTVTATASDDEGTTVQAQDSATVTVTDVAPAMTLSKTASPSTVDEPGGSVSFAVRVDNTGTAEAITLTALVDDVHGDLDGQGTCSVPQSIAASSFYECSFSATVSGNAGDSETDTVTATAADDEGTTVQAEDSATVTFTDVAPVITVTKTATPSTLEAPGGSVSFTVRVDNAGTAEAVTLTALVDDVHGDLDGQGTCSVPQSIAASSYYECSFSAVVSGSAGDSETDTVTATASDDEGTAVQAEGSATVSLVHPTPPEVTSVLAAPGTAVEDCASLRTPVSRIDISFSEVLDNPTSAGGYLLVGTGPDHDFSTLTCGGASGDDQLIPFSSITSDGADTASLEVATLAPGLYRLLVCDSLQDLDGNALDGDGDGDGGGHLVRSFRADPLNLFVNGNFDDCPVSLAPWEASRTAPDAVLPALVDADDSPLSGSAEVFGSSGLEARISQCVPVMAGAEHVLVASVRIEGPGALVSFERRCQFFSQADCGGTPAGESNAVSVVGDTQGSWLGFTSHPAAPAGATSARCAAGVVPIAGAGFNAWFDALRLSVRAEVFADGFESGATAGWTATVP